MTAVDFINQRAKKIISKERVIEKQIIQARTKLQIAEEKEQKRLERVEDWEIKERQRREDNLKDAKKEKDRIRSKNDYYKLNDMKCRIDNLDGGW